MSSTPPDSTEGPVEGKPRSEVEDPLAEGRYRLVRVLGVGGMATVYRAFDERLRVYRAVKVLSPNLAAHEGLRRRFQTEARTMARLHHPHIVGVHDIGADGNRVFIVMEMVEGGSAWDYLKRHGPLPAKLAVDICLAVLNALSLAHAKGVIHRDIKPHNVLLSREGTPKVADFGIAHVVDGGASAGLTKTGSVMGTWGFMAPEQRGGVKGVDARADLYAVGSTLYALLTDRLPVDLFVAELDDDLLQAIPGVLKPILQKSTRYRPDDRYGSAAEMAADLVEVLTRLPPVPEQQPVLGQFEPEPEESERGMTLVPGSMAGVVRGSSLTYVDEFLGKADSAPEAPADPMRRHGPPGFTGVPELDARASRPAHRRTAHKTPQVKLLGAAAAALLLVGGFLWASRGDPDPVRSEKPPKGVVTRPAPAPPVVVAPPVEVVVVAQPEPVPAKETSASSSKAARKGSGKRSERTAGKSSSKTSAQSEEKPSSSAAVAPVAEADATGMVFVRGDQSAVWLVAKDGSTHKPGDPLEPGSYKVKASFDGGKPVVAGKVRIAAGERVTLHCDAIFWKCQIQ